MMEYFEYGSKEIEYLAGRDERLGRLIGHYGPLRRRLYPDVFTGLAHCIVSQQITPRAAQTVFERFIDLVGAVTPENLLRFQPETIAERGLSLRKATCIRQLAESVESGEIDLKSLRFMDDADVVAHLTGLRGIGAWSAEMILIFALARKDIFSPGDYGIRRGLAKLYHKKEISDAQFTRYGRKYSPYGTIASFYLWELNGDRDYMP